eukprot:gene11996-16059_t
MNSQSNLSNNQNSYCRVHIRVRAHTKLGQVLAFSGITPSSSSTSCHTLGYAGHVHGGQGELAKGVELVTTPDSYPIWFTANPLVIPKGELIKYKYCVMEAGIVKFYEKREIPREVSSYDEVDILIEDELKLVDLQGSGKDSEMDLLEEVKILTRLAEPVNNELLSLRQGRLILVCYHLPVIVKRTGRANEPFEVSWAESLIAKSSGSISNSIQTMWMGTVSYGSSSITPAEKEYLDNVLRGMDCIPIYLEEEVARNAYQGYCKQIMWPVFHNVDQLDHIHAAWNIPAEFVDNTSNKSRFGAPTPVMTAENKVLEWNQNERKFFNSYKIVNSIFFEGLKANNVCSNDVVWVHDYHLMLLPQLLRSAMLSCKIVFFMHIPFPTSQIFRTLSEAVELLQSMVSADVVGFHAFDHARHFLNATKRMLGIKSYTRTGGMLTLRVQDREVIVTMSHVSIEPERLSIALQNPEMNRIAAELKEKYKNKKIIVGVDICQRLSGGALKLAAFDKLLSDYIGDKGSVILIQRNIRQGSRSEDEATTSNDMTSMAAVINAKYANHGIVVDYEEVNGNKLGINERLALWLIADVFLLTPIREGLNLMPLEYIYARKDLPHAGVLVVSEFSTCSSLLNGSLKVNPYSALNVADTVEKALNMPAKESNYRRQRDLTFVTSHPSSLWTRQILGDLEQLKESTTRATNNNSNEGFPIPLIGICESASRLFVFDYGGTLLYKEKYDIYIKQTLSAISGRRPTDRMMDAIQKLSEDPRNIVMVVTGLTKMKLGGTFNGMNNVTLVTSNGLVYSWGDNIRSIYMTEAHTDPAADEGIVLENPMSRTISSRSTFTSEPLLASAGDVNKGDDKADTDRPREVVGNYNSFSNTFRGYFSSVRGRASTKNSTTKDAYNQTTANDAALFNDHREWEFMETDIDWSAISDIALPIITKFTFRTNGTCKSPRIPGIGWSYFGADPDWGEKQASQLKVELEASLANYDVKIVSLIQGSIEVVPKSLDKGIMVKSLLSKVVEKRGGKLPLVSVIIGDEESDDKMFEALYDFIAASDPRADVKRMNAFTICVGKRKTPARFFVNDVKDVESLLSSLAESRTTIVPFTHTYHSE